MVLGSEVVLGGLLGDEEVEESLGMGMGCRHKGSMMSAETMDIRLLVLHVSGPGSCVPSGGL